jgi:RNA polymerase sigma-70 factor (ECF subfamily)
VRRSRPALGQTSDEYLVSAVVRGDQAALVVLYRRHGDAVWSLAQRVCRDRHLAEEICQTVFTDLWSAPERFDPGRGKFRSWLLAQSHARAVDTIRSETARRRREENEVAMAPDRSADVEVDAGLCLAELAASVRHALAQLPAPEREAIVLTYFAGHTYRAAACLLGQPEGTVKSRIRAGLRRLRTLLEADAPQALAGFTESSTTGSPST